MAGTVHDGSGAIVTGAAVTLTDINTQVSYLTVSNSDGRYTFPQLHVGSYKIAVSTLGFKQAVQEGIIVSVGNTAVVDIALQLGRTAESVVVNADAAQIQTESSGTSTSVSPILLQQLPLSYSGLIRSPVAFAEFTPGAAGNFAGNPGSQAGFKFNGAPIGSSEKILDGASLQLASPDLQMNFGISTDAVAEFNVQTSTFDAQYGRMGGGFVNMVSKSGTNDIHGGIYELIKNDSFDANGWNNNHLGNRRPFDKQHDFGGFAGGPLWIPKLYDGRGKTFWFFSYEGFREKVGNQQTADLPTPAMWNGDFSSIWNNGQPWVINNITYAPRRIYDYTTCSGANIGKPCKAFPNNQIPMSRLDPITKNYIQYLPKATITTQPYQNEKNQTLNPVNDDLFSIRIDQSIGASHKLYGSFDVAKMPILNQNLTFGPLYTNDFGGTNSHYVRLAEDYTISPSILNHLNFGFTRRYRAETSTNTIGPWSSKLGWHGGLVDKIIPWFDVQYGQASHMPNPPSNDSEFFDNNYQFNEALSWSHGNHTWQFGLEHRRQEFNVRFYSNTGGHLLYNDQLTSAGTDASGNQIDPNSGLGVASLFLGAISTGDITAPQANGYRAIYSAGYIKDDWKISPKLTANLGLRYEIPQPVYEAQSRTSQVNVTLQNSAAGGLPGALEFQGKGPGRDGRHSPMDTFYKSFGPRLGIAYEVDPQTALRISYGIYFDSIKVSNFANSDSAGFFGLQYNFDAPTNQQTPAGIPSQIAGYPGPIPPFINPTFSNKQSPVFLNTKVARPGTIQNWTVDIQRQLPGQWLLDAAYVGAHGDHLQAEMRDPNVGPLSAMSKGACLAVLITDQLTNPACAGQTPVKLPYNNFVADFGSRATVSQALRPFPQYGNAGLDTALDGSPFGAYTYHAFQARINKRFGSGLTVLANYTWSKSLTNSDSDYAPQAGWNGGNQGLYNPYNPKGEKALSNYDSPHVANILYVYELPIGKGKRFANHNRVVDVVVGGWKVGGVDTYSSGTPLWVTQNGWTSGIFAGEATGSRARPNIVRGVDTSGFHGGGFVFGKTRKLNPAAFTAAPSYTFGNSPRMLGTRNFANRNENLDVEKNIGLGTERAHLLLRVDAFNIFNRHTWGGIDNNISDPNFGEATSAYGARTMQGNLRLTF